MKVYTEEQVLMAINFGCLGVPDLTPEEYVDSLTPIELPSNEEAGVIALKIADTLKDKLTTEQEAYFIAGFQTCAKWVKEQNT